MLGIGLKPRCFREVWVMKGPKRGGKDKEPKEPGGRALQRLRQFEAERGVPPSVQPGAEETGARPANTTKPPKKRRGK